MKAEVTTVSSRGQVVIPRSLRELLEIKEGTRLTVFPVDESMLVMKKLEIPDSVQALEDLFARLDEIRPRISEEEIREEIQAVRQSKQR